MPLPRPPLAAGLLALAILPGPPAQDAPGAPLGRSWEERIQTGPGPSRPDEFHPERGRAVEPRRGGRAIVHVQTLPKNFNFMVENSAVTRWMAYETHEYLIDRDWETWEYVPVLAAELPTVEDALYLTPGREGVEPRRVYGRVERDGEEWLVTPLSRGNPLGAPLRVAADEVERHEPGTVFTFTLRDDVRWQDGHPFDAGDVLFTYRAWANPWVDCDAKRFIFEKFDGAEQVDERTVRFFYGETYFLAREAFRYFFLLPSHLYDLSDPDNPAHDPEADDEAQGAFVNENPHNLMWVGLGPYRITEVDAQQVDARRWDGYFDAERGGWLDVIRWRHIADDEAAARALLNRELDFWDRLSSEQYFGDFCRQEAFVDSFYKGYQLYPYVSYGPWNLRRPLFADARVRRALAHCFDWDEYIETLCRGLGTRVTGVAFRFAEHYDDSIEPIPFDLRRAEELLGEAGWYDRDGDGLVDRDGRPLRFAFMIPTGNKASERQAQLYQEDLARVGVKLDIESYDWATFREKLRTGDFDTANLAWVQSLEEDPEQFFHSRWADARGSNHAGLADPEVDRLIEAIQVELDDAARVELFHRLQRRVYELQPWLFGLNQPKKFAMSLRLRNFKTYANPPGYRIRDWFVAEPE